MLDQLENQPEFLPKGASKRLMEWAAFQTMEQLQKIQPHTFRYIDFWMGRQDVAGGKILTTLPPSFKKIEAELSLQTN